MQTVFLTVLGASITISVVVWVVITSAVENILTIQKLIGVMF